MTFNTLREHCDAGAVLLLVLLIGVSLTPAAAAPDLVKSTVFEYDPGTGNVPPTSQANGAGDAGGPITAEGRVMTTGDQIMGCDALRAYGITGTGVKVGVISDGVDGTAAAQTTGDLGWVYTISDELGGGEGTAMLEIIHDIAPGATLFFHDAGNNAQEFIRAIDALVAAGCTVIVDDITWLDQPYFEEGDIAKHLENLTATNKILYITHAGNYADKHFQGPFVNTGDGYQDFSGNGASYPYLYATIPYGRTFHVGLQWDEPFGSAGDDFDLYLVDSGSGIVLEKSTDGQTGKSNPIEYFRWTNPGAAREVTIMVHHNGGTGGARTLELYVYGAKLLRNDLSNNLIESDSIWGHQAVPDVVTVGAINATNPTTIEPFSSHGPITNLFPTHTLIQKPDISAPDYVNVTGYGRFYSPFDGTSAAAPHIAALCALVWSARPDLSPADIRSALYASASDLGTPGYDNVFGWGRADAVAMYNQLATGKPVNTEPPSVFRKFYPKGGPASGSIGGTIIRKDAGVGVPDSPIALPTRSPKKPPAKPFIRWYPGEN